MSVCVGEGGGEEKGKGVERIGEGGGRVKTDGGKTARPMEKIGKLEIREELVEQERVRVSGEMGWGGGGGANREHKRTNEG